VSTALERRHLQLHRLERDAQGIAGLPGTAGDRRTAGAQRAESPPMRRNPTGIWLGNYGAREIVVRRADVEEHASASPARFSQALWAVIVHRVRARFSSNTHGSRITSASSWGPRTRQHRKTANR
jgi:hypothetical protein